MFDFNDAIALKKAINEIDFPEENEKTLMDRFREVSNDTLAISPRTSLNVI